MIDEFDQNVHFVEIDIEEDPEIAEAAGIVGYLVFLITLFSISLISYYYLVLFSILLLCVCSLLLFVFNCWRTSLGQPSHDML